MVKITLTAGELSVSLEAETVEDVIKLYDAYCGESSNDGWIGWVWSEEKPYPETLDTKVCVRHFDGNESSGEYDVAWWRNGIDNWRDSIVAYRVVK